VPERVRPDVVDAMQRALAAWHAYRDEVALACGLTRAGTLSRVAAV
jgi:hypothetical protein